MKPLEFLLVALALASLLQAINCKPIVARPAIQKRQAQDPPKCGEEDSPDDDTIELDQAIEDEEVSLDFHQTDEQDEQDRQAVCRLVDGPVSRSRLLQITTRVSELLRRPEERSNRTSRIDATIDRLARNLIHSLTNEEASDTSNSPNEPTTPRQKRQRLQEDEFCVQTESNNKRGWKTRNSLAEAISMYDKGTPEDKVHKRHKWFYRQHLPEYRRCLSRTQSAPPSISMQEINEAVIEKFNETRAAGLTVHDDQLKEWALNLQRERNGPRYFRASDHWVHKLKRNNMIGGRKITKYVTQRELLKEHERLEKIENFRSTFRGINYYFPRRLILNTDQSGYNYELVDQRTLERVGTRDVLAVVGSASKISHSYTIQPLVTRDGRLVGKLFIIFKETDGTFPVTLEKKIVDLAKRYGNVYVVPSKSGKITNPLQDEWEKEVLLPAVRSLLAPHDGATDTGSNNASQSSSTTLVSLEDEVEEDHYRPDDDDFQYVQDNFNDNVGSCWFYPWLNTCAHGILQRGNETYLRKPDALLLRDSLTSHNNARAGMRLRELGVKSMIIPPKTTDYLQPLDISLFRQWKAFVKRLTRQARLDGLLEQITSREGIINMQSLVFNQLQAPMYQDLARYGWRHLDPDFSELEYSHPRPILSIKQQFVHNSSKPCEVAGCAKSSYIKCSHCGKHLCLKHFLERACFHEDSPEAGTSGVTRAPRNQTPDDDDYDY